MMESRSVLVLRLVSGTRFIGSLRAERSPQRLHRAPGTRQGAEPRPAAGQQLQLITAQSHQEKLVISWILVFLPWKKRRNVEN